jgi:hypothetical protein
LTFKNITDKGLIITLPFKDKIYPWKVTVLKDNEVISKPVPSVTCLGVNQDEQQVKAKLIYRDILVQSGHTIDVLLPLLTILDSPLTLGSYEIQFQLNNVINGILPIDIM